MSNEDYELWAALMADDETETVLPAASPVVVSAPEPVLEAPKFFPLKPVAPTSQAETVSPYEARIPEFVPSAPVEPLPIPEVSPAVSELRVDTFVPSVEDLDEESEFPINLFKEPQTNSIVVPEVPDALALDIVTDSGEVLKTGAIDMPLLNNTGSIPIITITPDEVDEDAIKADMGDETTGGIPPIRSGSVMNSSARVGVLPIKNRRSEGQTILLATTSILLVTLGAGLIAAYMFKLI